MKFKFKKTKQLANVLAELPVPAPTPEPEPEPLTPTPPEEGQSWLDFIKKRQPAPQGWVKVTFYVFVFVAVLGALIYWITNDPILRIKCGLSTECQEARELANERKRRDRSQSCHQRRS